MKYPRYPAYKDSGVEWLGEIPAHWTVLPATRLICEIGNGTTVNQVDPGEHTKTVTRIETISNGEVNFDRIGHVDGFSGLDRYRLQRGDILFSNINSLNMIGNCAIFDSDIELYVGMNLLRIRFDNRLVNSLWMLYLLKSVGFRQQVEANANPAINQASIPISTIKSLICCLPCTAEQTAIAAFLDREIAKIDTLIAKQERLVDLLQERRNALVPSEWSGASVVRMSSVAEVILRPVFQQEEEIYTPIGLFNRGRGLFHKEPRAMAEMGDSDFFWIKEGDLIISGQFAWEGAIALASQDEENCVVSHRYPVLRGKNGVARTEYIFAFLATRHGNFLLNENSRGAAGRNRPLNIASLMKEKIPIPSMCVQDDIAKLVHAERQLREKIDTQVKVLNERRSALISAAVTGKIDVRNLAN